MTAKLHKKLIFYVTLQNQCDETMKRWLRYIFHFDHLIIVLLALLLTFLVSLIFDVLGLKNPYLKSVSHNSLTETYYQYSSNEEEIATNDNIVIIDWGLNASRDHIAGLLEKIDSLEPVAVGLDAIFPNPSNSEIDQRLKDALGRMAHKVVLAQMTDDEGETVKTFFADSMGLHSGSIMLNIDNETIHTFSALQDGDSSMVAILNEMWNAHYGIDNTLELKESPITIDYAHNFEVINSEDIDDYADEIKDHIVLVGSVTAGVDVSRVPTQRAYMSGVEIHAALLKMLLPTTLPIAMSVSPFLAATTDVASSGNDVPADTIVSAITDSLTPNSVAMPEAPSTNQSPPKIRAAKPNTINRMDFHIGISVSEGFSSTRLDDLREVKMVNPI